MINIKIDAEKQHENAQHNLNVSAVIACDPRGAGGKPAGSRRSESDAETVKQGHPSAEQKNHQDQRHSRINPVENHGGGAHSGNQLARRGPRHLRPHQMHGIIIFHRHHHEHEDQHSHTPDPVGKAAPEDNAVAQILRPGQYGRSGGGKA